MPKTHLKLLAVLLPLLAAAIIANVILNTPLVEFSHSTANACRCYQPMQAVVRICQNATKNGG